MGRTERFWLLQASAILIGFVVCASAQAEGQLWQTNFEEAKARAKAEKKLVLVNFTGSDWCLYCEKLKSEVFDKEAFVNEVPKSFVLVELDFPHSKEQPKDLKEQNKKLAEQYDMYIFGYPSVLLMDADGKVFSKTGYRDKGPKEWVENLGSLVTTYKQLVAMKRDLDKVQSLDRAKLLDAIVAGGDKLEVADENEDKYAAEIIALDSDDKVGLKTKYTVRTLIAEGDRLRIEEKFADAATVLGKALALPGVTGEQKQDVLYAIGSVYFQQQDYIRVVENLEKAIEAAPGSEKAAMIKEMIQEKHGPRAEAQSAIAKLKVEADKVQGLDKAKILDQMIEIQMNSNPYDRAADTAKWSKEIITLDAENKLGLKTKYQLDELLLESARNMVPQRIAKVQEAIAKARLLPGLTDEQKKRIDFQQEKMSELNRK